jgi:hypothetical protein
MNRFALGVCGIAAALLLIVACPQCRVGYGNPDPLAQLHGIPGTVKRAESLGLYWCGRHGPDKDTSVTVSVKPITPEQANGLHLARPPQAWAGRARIYKQFAGGAQGVDLEAHPGLARVDLEAVIIIGDPDVVRMLVEHHRP